MHNKKSGTQFERVFADILAQNRFWVHLFQDNKNGQPCDIIAAKDRRTYLFDCKNCEKDYFLVSRMEENQFNAMFLFRRTGNRDGYFVIQFPGEEIYLLRYWIIKVFIECGLKRLSKQDCARYGRSLSWWLRIEEIHGADGAFCSDGTPLSLRRDLIQTGRVKTDAGSDR